jgi:hypothetical protein
MSCSVDIHEQILICVGRVWREDFTAGSMIAWLALIALIIPVIWIDWVDHVVLLTIL